HYTGKKRSHIIEADFSLDGANPRDLTPASAVGNAETPTFFVGGVQNYAWAPDSKEIAYVTNLDKVPAASTNNDVFTLRLDEPGAKAVKVSTSPGSDDEPEYSPDGKWLAFRSQAHVGFESDRFRLMLFDREKKTARELTERFDRWVDEFGWAANSRSIFVAGGDSGEEPVFVVDIARPMFRQITESGEYGSLAVSPLVSRGDGTVVATRMRTSGPSEVVALLADQPVTIVDTMRLLPKPGEAAFPPVSGASFTYVNQLQLSHMNEPLLSSLELPELESFWFDGAEVTKVEGFLIKPPGFDPAKKYPVKFLMHGGPQTAWGDGWSFRWNWELMASSGYVVVGINRRGSTGYGQKFVDEVSGDWGGRAYEDLMKGLDYAEAHYPFIDKTRECALGASYGGYMANWVLTHTNRFKCIVTHDGLYDPVSAWGDTEEMWFNEWEFRRPGDFPKGWDGFATIGKPMSQNRDMGHPAGPTDRDETAMNGARSVIGDGHAAEPWRYASLPADQDPFRKWSPMRFIENAKTPTLIIHSQRDYRLDVSQGMAMFTALQRLNVPSRMMYFPDEGHWVLKPQNSQMWNEVVGDWCDRWTKSGKYAEKQ
ncbi:MAG TPA: S9 family peptidase, partial [Acidobacteriaceae bacterium]